jgi:phosphoglycerate dehydrogenase-like enzyme
MPDFLSWCETFRARLPGLYPSRVQFAEDQKEFDAKLADADLAIVESFCVTREALVRAERLVAVQKFGAIPTGIDIEACAEKLIAVLTVRRSVNIAVAEQVFALMLALSKRIGELSGVVTERQLRDKGYDPRPYDRRYTGGSNYARIPDLRTLAGSTLGMVGLGEVGREVAARANAFGMSVLYFQRSRLAPFDGMALGARYVPLKELMANSDIIVVQLPLTESTRGLIGREALAALKPGAILINAARAALVDKDALLDALDSGQLGGLGMDVGYSEPWAPEDPLLRYTKGNVILMPHTAIAHRRNGLNDLSEMCLGLWRAAFGPRRLKVPKPR